MTPDAEFEAWWNLVRGDESTAPAIEIARAAAEWATERAAKAERERCGGIADSYIVTDPPNEVVQYGNHIARSIYGRIFSGGQP